MINPIFVEVVSALLLVANIIYVVKNYLLGMNESDLGYRNVMLYVAIVVLFIASGINIGAGIDLSGILYILTHEIETLSDASIEQYQARKALMENFVLVIGTIQIISACIICKLTLSIKKERILSVKNRENKWDWEKLRK